MIRKLTFGAVFGAGYVLGARAGKERYRQIETKFHELAGKPAVQDLASNLADTAGQLGEKAKAAVSDTVAAVSDKVSGDDVVDLSTPAKSKTTARPSAGPSGPV